MKTWVVPGCPLEGGRGWKVWFSWPGAAPMPPPRVTVRLAGREQVLDQAPALWTVMPGPDGLGRRMAIYEIRIQEPRPGSEYAVTIDGDEPHEFSWRTLPDRIPDDGLTFMLASCFWRDDDGGHYQAAVRSIPAGWKPAFKLLVGDQVYGDWPSERSVAGGAEKPLDVYAERYEEYWGDETYRDVLGSCPNFFVCDDHEFWNDFPEFQIHLARSYPRVKAKYGKAAHDLYRLYQRCNNPGPDLWSSFRIGNVSFFMADTRSQREECASDGTSRFMQEDQWQALEAWAAALDGPGLLLLGQPIYQKEGGRADHTLPNFVDDYSRLWKVIEGCLEGAGRDGRPHSLLVLSGDIHTGRYTVGRRMDKEVPEVIASPAAMIKPGSRSPSAPPTRITVGREGGTRSWDIARPTFMRLDNNVALVQLRPRPGGEVTLLAQFWRVRPFDGRRWWEKAVRRDREEGGPVFMLEKPIERVLR